MKNRTIPPEQFIEFVIENGLKNIPELVDMIPVEKMYEILKRNILNVYECNDKYITFFGFYSMFDKSIYIVNREEVFDKTTMEREKGTCVHESIHALFTKNIINDEHRKKIKGIQKIKSNRLYNKQLFRSIRKLANRNTLQTGSEKWNGTLFSSYRNIKGVLSGDAKYKYKGSLISKFFQIRSSFNNGVSAKGLGLNEGFTEWLAGKACGKTDGYKNEVLIIDQIEAALGVRKTLEIGNGNYEDILKMLGMSKTDFEEFIYRLDEDTRAGYRESGFNKMLEETGKTLTEKEKIRLFIDKISWGYNNKPKREEEIRDYFDSIKNENLSKAEEILLDKCIEPKIQSLIDKNDLSMSDIKRYIDIYKSVENFLLCSDIKDELFAEENVVYNTFKKICAKFENKLFNQYQDKLKELSLEELGIINNLYIESQMYETEIKTKDAFIENVNSQKVEIFEKLIFPEFKKRVDINSNIDVKQVLDFYNLYRIFIDETKLKEYILKAKGTEEDIKKIERLFGLENDIRFLNEMDIEYDFDEFIPISEYESIEDELYENDEIDSVPKIDIEENMDMSRISFKNVIGRILKKKSIDSNEIIDIESTMQYENNKDR